MRFWGLLARDLGGNSTLARGRPDDVMMRSSLVERAAAGPPPPPMPPEAIGTVTAAMGPPLGHPATLVSVAVARSCRTLASSRPDRRCDSR